MASTKQVDGEYRLYLDRWEQPVWKGWLWKASLGHADPKHLQAYEPRMYWRNRHGEWEETRQVAYVRDTGTRGPGQWEIILFGGIVGAKRTKSEAQHELRDLLGA